MRDLRLADHIHFCVIGDERIFLDLLSDRYFALPPAAEIAFRALEHTTGSADACPAELEHLRRAGILVETPHGRPIGATRHLRPEASLSEAAGPPPKPSVGAIADVLVLVLMARRALRRKSLPDHLTRLSALRPRGHNDSATERNRAVARFRGARPFVPIAPNCLSDSLALARFLRRRGIAADLVIGVKLHPFAAHAWVQDGSTVLNDALAHARDFEPVLVA